MPTWLEQLPTLHDLCDDPITWLGLPVRPVAPLQHRKGDALLVYDARVPPRDHVAALWEDPARPVWTPIDQLRCNLAHPLGYAWACRQLAALTTDPEIVAACRCLLVPWLSNTVSDDDRGALAALLRVAVSLRSPRAAPAAPAARAPRLAAAAAAVGVAADAVAAAAAVPGPRGDKVEAAANAVSAAADAVVVVASAPPRQRRGRKAADAPVARRRRKPASTK